MTNREVLSQFKRWYDSGFSKSETPNSESLVHSIRLLEKQEPKKPTIKDKEHTLYVNPVYVCPNCGERLNNICGYCEFEDDLYKFCPNCGQATDWSE